METLVDDLAVALDGDDVVVALDGDDLERDGCCLSVPVEWLEDCSCLP